eukprot:SAG31_NODE_22316_length_528_cov_1.097902_1_plen_45_part_10
MDPRSSPARARRAAATARGSARRGVRGRILYLISESLTWPSMLMP